MIYRFLFISLLLASCASDQVLTARKSVLSDPDTPEAIKKQVRQNRIAVGMTKNQVIASWGRPCSNLCYGTKINTAGDIWKYNKNAGIHFEEVVNRSETYLYFSKNGVLHYWSRAELFDDKE